MSEKDDTRAQETSIKPKSQNPGARSKRAQWNSNCDSILVAELLAQKDQGNQTDNAGFKSDAWTAVEKKLAGTEMFSGGPRKTAEQCSTRYRTLKSEFKLVHTMRGLSGWGWDDNDCHVIVSDEVWEAYVLWVKGHQVASTSPNAVIKAEGWRYKSFPLYDDLSTLILGQVATGEHAFNPNDSQETQISDPPSTQSAWDPDHDPGQGGSVPPARPLSQEDSFQTRQQTPLMRMKTKSYRNRLPAFSDVLQAAVRKRVRALDDSPETDPAKRPCTDGHGRKPSTGHAMMAVSSSLNKVAEALTVNPGDPSSPQRRREAVLSIKKMEDFSQHEKIQMCQLIAADTNVADCFLALIDPEDPELAIGYLRSEVDARQTQSQN
ncbi:hypothetical protein C8J56DRAFT_1043411 [Mycena floridula]|nr:hypothetical protein C8J56DRAFT_1043411 [Mycena floridula]